MFLDSHAIEKVAFFRALLGEYEFDKLNIAAEFVTHGTDYATVELYYKEKLKELEEGI